MDFKYKEGDFVQFKLAEDVYGSGYVIGVALTQYPVIGAMFIIQYTALSIPYDYTAITAFESQIY